MEKIDKDKFKKKHVKEYFRVYSRDALEKERQGLVKRVADIDELLGEIKKVK